MPILPYASLDEMRQAISRKRKLRFMYRKERVEAEPYLLGNFRKTHALVLMAWATRPVEGWEYYRVAGMRDVEVLPEVFTVLRRDFNPYDPRIAGIDTTVRGSRSA